MPSATPWILHRFYTLDTSLDFLRGLYSLIHHDEKEQYLTSLQGPELARLVDFLDGIRTVSSSFQISPVCEIPLQVLSAIYTIPLAPHPGPWHTIPGAGGPRYY